MFDSSIPEGAEWGLPLIVDYIFDFGGNSDFSSFRGIVVGLLIKAAFCITATFGAWCLAVPGWFAWRLLPRYAKSKRESVNRWPVHQLVSVMAWACVGACSWYFLALLLHGWLGNHCGLPTGNCAGPNHDAIAQIARIVIFVPLVVFLILWTLAMSLATGFELIHAGPEQRGALLAMLLTILPHLLF
jgi:hypothetical protein